MTNVRDIPYRFTSQSLPQLASWVGFDRVWSELERVQEQQFKNGGFPPYNVKKIDDNHFQIEMACAGFSKADIDITTKDDQLVIKGEVKADPDSNYLYKGIAERAFQRSFTLADSIVVKNASMFNGMLKIFLEQFIPEEKRAKKVEINDADSSDIKTVKNSKQFLTE